MIANTCPFCGSVDWDYEEKFDERWTSDGCWADWDCRCRKCDGSFRRLESYKLTEAKHKAFEED